MALRRPPAPISTSRPKNCLSRKRLLAGIPRACLHSPYINEDTREAAFRRQKQVLSRMEEEGFITGEEKTAALQQELVFSGREALRSEQYFAAYFIDYLINYEIMTKLKIYTSDPHIIYRGGLHIHTTLDKKIQEAAENVFANPDILPEAIVNDAGQLVPLQCALVALDPHDGSVLAMMGDATLKPV